MLQNEWVSENDFDWHMSPEQTGNSSPTEQPLIGQRRVSPTPPRRASLPGHEPTSPDHSEIISLDRWPSPLRHGEGEIEQFGGSTCSWRKNRQKEVILPQRFSVTQRTRQESNRRLQIRYLTALPAAPQRHWTSLGESLWLTWQFTDKKRQCYPLRFFL